jgi:hypothetical protein
MKIGSAIAQVEANVYLKHVATRLDEIRVLTERVNISDEAKAEHINQTVLALNRDLTSARQSLQIAAKNSAKNSGAAVVAVARGLTKSTSDVKAALSSAKGELTQSASEAISSADEASTDSLQILLDTYAKDQQQVDKSELAGLVEQELSNVGDRIGEVEASAVESGSQEVRLKVRQTLFSMLSEHRPSPFDLPTYDGLRSYMAKAHKQMEEAERYLKYADFANAVSWAHQAKETAETVAATLRQASNLISVPLLPESTLSTTTSPATTTPPTATTTAAAAPREPAESVEAAVETTASQLKK